MRFDFAQFLPLAAVKGCGAGSEAGAGVRVEVRGGATRTEGAKAAGTGSRIGGSVDDSALAVLRESSEWDSPERRHKDRVASPAHTVSGTGGGGGCGGMLSPASARAPLILPASPDPGTSFLPAHNPLLEMCDVVQQYETPVHPCGCTVRLVVRSTWGDPYYVGLNGIELLDTAGRVISLSPDQLQATPYRDVNDLPEVQLRGGRDSRSLENLIAHGNDGFGKCQCVCVPMCLCDCVSCCSRATLWYPCKPPLTPLTPPFTPAFREDDRCMWLVPTSLGPDSRPPTVFVHMDEPTALSAVKVCPAASLVECPPWSRPNPCPSALHLRLVQVCTCRPPPHDTLPHPAALDT